VKANEEMRGIDLDEWMKRIKRKYLIRKEKIESARHS
jgi:hypothetical protein